MKKKRKIKKKKNKKKAKKKKKRKGEFGLPLKWILQMVQPPLPPLT